MTRFKRLLLLLVLLPAILTAGEDIAYFPVDATVYDERFHRFVATNSRVEVLAEGFEWAEGPVWVRALDALLFSDVAADRVYRWDELSGVQLYLQPSGHAPDDQGSAWRGANGLAVDAQGNLLLAQQSSRRLARMTAPLEAPLPAFDVLASQFEKRALNSPNDLVVSASGDIYFTDPPYGLAGFEQSPDIELDFFGVFRLAPDGQLSVIAGQLEKPNGVALSPDQAMLYVSNSEVGKAGIFAIDLVHPAAEKPARRLFDAAFLESDGPGSTDGLAVHASGTLFVSIPNGIALLSPEGDLIGKLALGQVTNLAFDPKGEWLYITSPTRLMRLAILSP